MASDKSPAQSPAVHASCSLTPAEIAAHRERVAPLSAAEREELRRLRRAMCEARMAEDASGVDDVKFDAPLETLNHIQAAFAFANQAHYDLDRLLDGCEMAAELEAEVTACREVLWRLATWTHEMGAALKPPSVDSYGEGIRDAKAQVARMLARAALAKEPDDGR